MPQLLQIHEESALSLAREILTSSGRLRLQVLGTSMLPCIWPGEVLTLLAVRGNDVRIGDIVLFTRGRQFVIHRVVGTEGPDWITRGASVSQNDPPVGRQELLAKVVAIERKGELIVPKPLRLGTRLSAWLLCHSGFIRNLTLRVRGILSPNIRDESRLAPDPTIRAFTA